MFQLIYIPPTYVTLMICYHFNFLLLEEEKKGIDYFITEK